MFFEAVKTAFKSLWSNKLRSFLTLIGMVIGIYAVVTLLAMAQGLQKQISDQVEGLGPRVIFVLPGETEEDSSIPNFASQFAPSTIFVDDVEYLKENSTLLEDQIDYVVIVGGTLRKDDKRVSALPFGSTVGVPEIVGLTEIVSGRALSQTDIQQKRRVIFLDQTTADKLEANTGDTINLGLEEFELAGIYKDPEGSGLSFGDSSSFVIIPATVASEINQSNQVNRIVAIAKDVEKVEEARDEITELLKEKRSGNQDFTVLLSSDLLDSITQITDLLKFAVVGIAAISLLVGGIGVSNIMLVTVTERTREIGIRKAVGATESAILLQFLIESIILTTIGALIGLTMAWATSEAVAAFTPLQPSITTGTVWLAIGMGAVTGILFGIFPAARAARKHPVNALRYE